MGTLRDSSGRPVLSGSNEPIKTRYDDDEDKAAKATKEDKYDLESVKKPRSIEEQIGRKAESKTQTSSEDEEPRRKISDYSKPSGPFSNVMAAVESATRKDSGDTTARPVKASAPAPKKTEAPKKEAPSSMPSAKETMEKGRAGPAETPKKKEEQKPAPVTRTRAGAPVATRKEPTEAEKESGRKFSEEKLRKQREEFENTPLMRMLKGAGGRSEYYKKKADAERQGYGMKKGGSVSSASKRADGIAQRGKTRGRIY